MERFLGLSANERQLAFEQAAGARGLPPTSVEKDFWVTLVLRELFAMPDLAGHLTFKGGTSLSKAWGLIERFSEDLDLTISREFLGFAGDRAPDAATGSNERARRITALKSECRRLIQEEITPALTTRLAQVIPAADSWSLRADPDDSEGQTLLFAYPRHSEQTLPAYLSHSVKLEFGARSDPWPIEDRRVRAIVAEVYPTLFGEAAVTVHALRPERTFWEKVMLLHEENFRPVGTVRPRGMARHYYDVWRLIESGVGASAAADLELFRQVAAHREVYFRRGWVDYGSLVRGRIRCLPAPETRAEWEEDYAAMQGEMFVTPPPPFEVVVQRLAAFEAEFNAG